MHAHGLITNGDVIRFKNQRGRNAYVAISWGNVRKKRIRVRMRKHIKDYTGFMLFSGLWYGGDPLTSEPYGKGGFHLKMGHFGSFDVIGNITENKDLIKELL